MKADRSTLKPDRDERGRFLNGNNRAVGRPRGSRNKLGQDFLDALADDFSEHGVASIRKMRETDNTAYVKVVSNVLPREVIVAALNVNVNATAEDEDFAQYLADWRIVRMARQRIGISEQSEMIDISPTETGNGD